MNKKYSFHIISITVLCSIPFAAHCVRIVSPDGTQVEASEELISYAYYKAQQLTPSEIAKKEELEFFARVLNFTTTDVLVRKNPSYDTKEANDEYQKEYTFLFADENLLKTAGIGSLYGISCIKELLSNKLYGQYIDMIYKKCSDPYDVPDCLSAQDRAHIVKELKEPFNSVALTSENALQKEGALHIIQIIESRQEKEKAAFIKNPTDFPEDFFTGISQEEFNTLDLKNISAKDIEILKRNITTPLS